MNRRIKLGLAVAGGLAAVTMTGATAASAATVPAPTPVHVAPAGSFYACIGFAVNGQPAFISSKFTTNVGAARDCQARQQLQTIQRPTLLLRYKPMLVSQS